MVVSNIDGLEVEIEATGMLMRSQNATGKFATDKLGQVLSWFSPVLDLILV
jgi:hypothetical protein